MTPSEEEKSDFLQHIRDGCDRPTAAYRVNVTYTGTMFKRMCNPDSKHFDAEFSQAYSLALKDRGPLDPNREKNYAGPRPPRTVTSTGATRWDYLDEDDREGFLERVRNGVPPTTAAHEVGTTYTQIHKLTDRDPEFRAAYEEAKVDSKPSFRESLRAQAYKLAMQGEYKALRDLLLIHDPAFEVLRTQRHEIGGLGGGPLRMLAEQHLSNLPPELLDKVIEELEAQVKEEERRNKELTA